MHPPGGLRFPINVGSIQYCLSLFVTALTCTTSSLSVPVSYLFFDLLF